MNNNGGQLASSGGSLLPWLAVAGYLIAAWLCWRQRQAAGDDRERLFWLLLTLAMLALGINKQLDLQTALTAWGRQMARDGGWYADRRAFQRNFVLAGMIVMSALVIGLLWLVRRMRANVLVALAGLCILGVFVLLRAASFSHIDQAMRQVVFGFRLRVLLEFAGIAVVIAGAAWAPAKQGPPVPIRPPSP